MQQNQVIQHRLSGWEYEIPTVYGCVHTHTCTTILGSPTPRLPPQPQGTVDKTF